MNYKWRMMLLIFGILLWSGCNSILQPNGQSVKEHSQTNRTRLTPTPPPQKLTFSKDLDELKERFNNNKGKVRLVTLLSPT